MKEDEILDVYVQEEDWLLVSSRSEEGKIGYVPGNYVEEVRPHTLLGWLENVSGAGRFVRTCQLQ